mmetsp:Transcript_92126/g.260768  ORF Transcript_92126/g.260768 Transcript_92126/m.260768 type:complete len:415 (-) Transcript_92126:164-1408(-)
MGPTCAKVATHEALAAGCTLPFWPRSWAYRGARLEELSADVFAALPRGAVVIVKPSKESGGNGIDMARGKDELRRVLLNIRRSLRESAKGGHDLLRITDEAIIQHYVEPPLLLGGLKFDCRVYVFVCPADDRCQADESFGPAFLCREGLARFSTKPYASPQDSNFISADVHLTNTSLSKSSEDFEVTQDPESGRHGSKRKLSAVLACLEQDGALSVRAFWKSVEVIATTVLRRFCPSVYQNATAKATYTTPPIPGLDWKSCADKAPARFGQSFCLLGLDVLLSGQGEMFLLEVNAAPSLAIDDVIPIKGPFRGSSGGEVSSPPPLSPPRGEAKPRRQRWAVHYNVGVDFGQRCRCSSHAAAHRHELSLVDWSIKSAVVRGALQILDARDHGKNETTWANGTAYSSLHNVPTLYL